MLRDRKAELRAGFWVDNDDHVSPQEAPDCPVRLGTAFARAGMALGRILILSAGLLCTAMGNYGQSFTQVGINFGKAFRGPVLWADFDNDGDLDLALSRTSDAPAKNVTMIWRNDRNERFTEVDAGLTGVIEGWIEAGDIDRDGLLDLAVSGRELDVNGFAQPRAQVLRNRGGFRFELVLDDQSGPMDFGDYDRDGDLDLIHSSQNPHLDRIASLVQANDGKGRFTPVQIERRNTGSMQMEWIDFDSDGELDAVFNSSQAHPPGVFLLGYRNRSSESAPDFFEAVDFPAGVINGFFLSWTDIDGDGDIDAVGQKQGDFRPYLIRNNGARNFIPSTAALVDLPAWQLFFGDADNDGDADAFVATWQGAESHIALNDGSGNFSVSVSGFKSGSFGENAAWGDYDADGDLDLFYTTSCNGEGCQGSSVYRNNANNENMLPSAPSELRSRQLENGDLKLEWLAAVDAETKNQHLLSYETRVGTAPGKHDIVAPVSDPLTGFRRLAAPGAERTPFRLLRNLPKGTYFWSVQTVDSIFAGSAWAAEQSFHVTNTAPKISRVALIQIAKSARTTVSFDVEDAESAATSIVVYAESEDEELISAESLAHSGTGTTRTIAFHPAFGKIGNTRLVLIARDLDGLETRRSFQVTVEEFSCKTSIFPWEVSSLNVARFPAADYDGDGDLDFYVSGQRRKAVSPFQEPFHVLLRNDGTGNFSVGPEVQAFDYWSPAAAGDFDHDGDVDLLSSSSLRSNKGDGTFAVRQLPLPDMPMVPGDIDGDGKIDMLTRLYRSSVQHFVYTRRGDQWESPGPFSEPQLGFMELSDFDRDGDLDILNGPYVLGQGWSNRIARLFLNSGAGRFDRTRDIPNVAGSFSWVTDDDSDGDLDIVTWIPDSPTGNEYFRMANDGFGNFTSNRVERTYGASTIDYDQDGDLDFMGSVSEDGQTRWYLFRRDGENEMVRRDLRFPGALPDQIGDFDNDGDLDFVAAETEGGTDNRLDILFIRNNADSTNAFPSVITGLSSSQPFDEKVALSWDAATDDHTPPYLLSYNLRIGTVPGGIDVVAPHGLIAQEGNVAKSLSRVFYRLPPGKYFWSVQALDGQYQRGPWADERTFALDIPGIAPLADVSMPPSTPSRPISIFVSGDTASAAADLILSARSENTNVIPASGLVLGGAGTNRTLVVTPRESDGEAFVQVTATDRIGQSFSRRFLVSVRQFAPGSFASIRGLSSKMQWVDADADGDLDLISLAHESAATARVAYSENSEGAELVLRTNALPLNFKGAVLIGDDNGDNHVDLFLSGLLRNVDGSMSPEARFWSAVNGSTFAPRSAQLTNLSALIDATDKDADRIPDVALWSPRNRSGAGQDGLTPAEISLPDNARTNLISLSWSDLDADGDLDLALAGSKRLSGGLTAPFAGVWSRERGSFDLVTTGLPTAEPARWTTADFDGDGLPDILVSPQYPSPANPPRIWRNLGQFRFESTESTFPPSLNGPPAVGDFDGDGDPDLAMTAAFREPEEGFSTPNGPISIYRNTGAHWELAILSFPIAVVRDAAWGDIDNDGDLDLAIGGDDHRSALRTIYRNLSFSSNAPPAVPSGLSFSRVANGVLLHWARPSDAEDARFLTYNLRIGTTLGGSDILSAAADLATGRRRISGAGNGSSFPKWMVQDLPNGAYFWSVQATDAGHASSGFSLESSFTISRPQLRGLSNMTVRANSLAGPFHFVVSDTETPPEALKITVRSADETLISGARIESAGSSGEMTLQFSPAAHRSGSTKLILALEDADAELSVVELNVTVREEFELGPALLPPFQNGAAAWGDIDQDGDLDLFAGGWTRLLTAANAISGIWQNQGGFLSETPLETLANVAGGAVAFADADVDSKLDLLVTGSNEGKVYFNVGMLHSDLPAKRVAAMKSAAGSWGDLNSDGKPELLLSGQSADFQLQTLVYRNLITNFVSFAPLNYGLRDGGAVWFDMDRDGDDDILANGFNQYAGHHNTALLSNENGMLYSVGSLPALGMGTVAVADYNLDGAPDIFIAGQRDENRIENVALLFRNNGSGGFELEPAPFPPVLHATAAWGDYDGDGDPDLIVSGLFGEEYKTHLWINETGRFRLSDNSFSHRAGRGVALGDADNDGDLDLALVGPRASDQYFSGIFVNSVDHGLNPPPNPIDLQASPDGVDVVLSWRMPAGSPRGLTFNVRAGSNSAAVDIVSPLAELQTGRRFLPGPGNAGWSFKRRLRGYAGRPVFWSVQAINPAFQASPFAPENEARVPRNEAPSISSPPLVTGPINQVIGPIDVVVNDQDNDPASIEVSFQVSNLALFPTEALQIERVGATHSVTLKPAFNLQGSATITVRATDPQGSASTNEFRITILSMTETAAGLLQTRASALEPADFDANGTMDLYFSGWEALTSSSGSGIRRLYTNVAGQFHELPAESLPSGDVHAAWGDMDDDGDLDLAAGSVVFENRSSAFAPRTPTIDSGAAAAWGDIDSDGDLDLALAGGRALIFRILRNNAGAFTNIPASFRPVREGAVAFGDPDNDGDLDLAITGAEYQVGQGSSSGTLRVYRNDLGSWTEVFSAGGVRNGVLQWADADRDGRADLLMAGLASTPYARLFMNNGGFRFTARSLAANASSTANPGALLFDLDNDGDLDLAEHSSTMFSVRPNDGSGQFAASSLAGANAFAGILEPADFDGDGDFDLVAGGRFSLSSYSGTVRIYRNHWISDFFKGQSLVSKLTNDSVELSWPQSRFQSNAPVTYNLRVGTLPGKGDVFSPLSALNGKRLVAENGNMGFANRAKLRSLKPGTYFWSIQPISTWMLGGAFAPDASFTVPGAIVLPRIESFVLLSSTTGKLAFSGTPGCSAVIEFSYDLRDWSAFRTAEIDSPESIEIIFETLSDTAFFRVRCAQ